MLGWLKKKGSVVAIKNSDLLMTDFMAKVQSNPTDMQEEIDIAVSVMCLELSEACEVFKTTYAEAVHRPTEPLRETFIGMSASYNKAARQERRDSLRVVEAFFSALGALPATDGRIESLRRIARLSHYASESHRLIEVAMDNKLLAEVGMLTRSFQGTGVGKLTLDAIMEVILSPSEFDLEPRSPKPI